MREADRQMVKVKREVVVCRIARITSHSRRQDKGSSPDATVRLALEREREQNGALKAQALVPARRVGPRDEAVGQQGTCSGPHRRYCYQSPSEMVGRREDRVSTGRKMDHEQPQHRKTLKT